MCNTANNPILPTTPPSHPRQYTNHWVPPRLKGWCDALVGLNLVHYIFSHHIFNPPPAAATRTEWLNQAHERYVHRAHMWIWCEGMRSPRGIWLREYVSYVVVANSKLNSNQQLIWGRQCEFELLNSDWFNAKQWSQAVEGGRDDVVCVWVCVERATQLCGSRNECNQVCSGTLSWLSGALDDWLSGGLQTATFCVVPRSPNLKYTKPTNVPRLVLYWHLFYWHAQIHRSSGESKKRYRLKHFNRQPHIR